MTRSCCDVNFSAKLIGTFNDVYQRSNKTSGKKNLRCFPRCREGVHKRSSFCGDAIEAQIMYSPISDQSDVDIDELIVLGEFTSVSPTADLKSISLGDVTSLKQVEEKIQHDAWFRSVMVKKEATMAHRDNIDSAVVSATIVFNVEKSWHYGWTSNRHTREQHHTFKVFALAPLRDTGGGTTFKCLGTYADGPTFRVSSTRRSASVSLPPPKRGREEAIVPYDGGIVGANLKRQKIPSTGASTSTGYRTPPQSTPSAPLEIDTAALQIPPTATDNIPSSFPPAPPRLVGGLSFDNPDGTLSMRDYLDSIEPPISSIPSSSSCSASPPPQSTPFSPLKQQIVDTTMAGPSAPAADRAPSSSFPPVPPRLVVGVLSFDNPVDGKINLSDYLDDASLPSIEPPISSTPSSSSCGASPPPQSTPFSPLKQQIVDTTMAGPSAPAADRTPSSFPPVPPRLVGVLSFDNPDGTFSIRDYLDSIEPPISSTLSSSSCSASPPPQSTPFSPLKQQIVDTTMAGRSAPAADKNSSSFPPVPPRLVGVLSFDNPDGTFSIRDYLDSIEPPISSTPSSSSCSASPPPQSTPFSPLKQQIVDTTMAGRSAPAADKNSSSFPPVPPRLVVGVLSFDSDGKLSLLDYVAAPAGGVPSPPTPPPLGKVSDDDTDGAALSGTAGGGGVV